MDVVEELRGIRSELLVCRATLLGVALDLADGKSDNVPERVARCAGRLADKHDVICELIKELGGEITY
jgi:hypothetical protein